MRLLTAVAALLALMGAGNAFAAGDVVISQVYGGGGNSGATLKNDYIELYNRGTTTVDISTWSVQYASSTGSSWARTNLSGSLAPGKYYLVQEAAGTGGTTSLPTPDATGSIAMSATTGKVALVMTQTALTCGSAPGNCFPNAAISDFVGYGTAATNFEGAGPTATLSNTTAALRNGGGTIDTDNNAADFTAGTPNPRNSGGTPPPPPPPTPELEIGQIQGASHTSPYEGQMVSTTGTVTATRIAGGRGFYLQDPSPDTSSATSEGIFIFTNAVPSVSIGTAVKVTGTVSEFRAATVNLSITQISTSNAAVSTLTTGNPLPAATVIGTGGLFPPTETIDDDSFATFDPANDAIDFYESLEGMLVKLNAGAAVVGPTKNFGEFVALPDMGSWTTGLRTPRGGILYSYADPQPERLAIDDEILRDQISPRPPRAMPNLDVGDVITSAIVGPLDYTFANYKIQATSTPTFVSGGLEPEVTAAPRDQEIAIATFNVENLDPSDTEALPRLAAQIVDNLRS
ncbi:MAG: lamin tail domain-containing protein, partial [Actinobacteria bacterium]|nr:lamin tail domain-containing protein [Actinomycetota bacterium]